MVKPMMAGLLCVGLVTLGVTISRGESADDVKANPGAGGGIAVVDVDVAVDGAVGFTDAPLLDVLYRFPNRLEVERLDLAGPAVEAGFVGDRLVFSQPPDGRPVKIVTGDDDKVVHFTFRGTVTDPAAREALEKALKALKQEAADLEKAGRKEEFERKTQSIAALEALLRGEAGGVRIFNRRVEGPVGIVQKIDALREQKIKSEIEDIRTKIVGLKDSKELKDESADQAKRALSEQMLAKMKALELLAQRQGPGSDEGAAAARERLAKVRAERAAGQKDLERKVNALVRGAEALKGAGLEDQARRLHEQAEQLKREAEAKNQEAEAIQKKVEAEFQQAIRAAEDAKAAAKEAGATAARYRDGKLQIMKLAPGAGGPMELQQSLIELRDQVQELRKEVAQLRSVLEKK